MSDVEEAADFVRNIERLAGRWHQLLGFCSRRCACSRKQQITAAAEDAAGPDEQLQIVVFIDDLDRCKPNKIVEVLEAINIVLAGSNFSVVVGMVSLQLQVGMSLLHRNVPPRLLTPTRRCVTHFPHAPGTFFVAQV